MTTTIPAALITPDNAADLRFLQPQRKEEAAPAAGVSSREESGPAAGGDAANGAAGEAASGAAATLGVAEAHAALLAAGASPPLADLPWVANHYRWVVWKLASYERLWAAQGQQQQQRPPGSSAGGGGGPGGEAPADGGGGEGAAALPAGRRLTWGNVLQQLQHR